MDEIVLVEAEAQVINRRPYTYTEQLARLFTHEHKLHPSAVYMYCAIAYF